MEARGRRRAGGRGQPEAIQVVIGLA